MSFLIDVMQCLAIAVLAIGLLLTVRKAKRKPSATIQQPRSVFRLEEPKAICGCEHHHCFHDEDGCGHVSQVRTFDTFRFEYYKNTRCKCKRYTGPEPLPRVIP